ncbi:MAG: hypothetical protein ACT4P3_16290 [Betaproteobacteria bacterium]
MMKAKAVRLFGIAMAAAGFVAVLYYGALFAWRKGWLPQFPWLEPRASLPAGELATLVLARVDVGLVIAALGVVALLAGVLTAMRQTAWLRAEARRREDGLRRVRQYRADEGRCPYDSRLEPFLGSPGAGRREEDRRVA